MNVKVGLVGAVLVLGLNGVAHAVSMFAGPLGGDGCSCNIVNISTSARTVDIQGLNKGGTVMNHLQKTLQPGQADGIPIGTSSIQYCKFVNASPNNFRAAIHCSDSGTGEFSVLPAR